MTSGSVSRRSQVPPTSLLLSELNSRHSVYDCPVIRLSCIHYLDHILQDLVLVIHQRYGEQPSRGAANAWSPAAMIVH